MKTLSFVALAALGVAASGCTTDPSPAGAAAHSSGQLSISQDDSRLFVADSDNDELLVVDAGNLAVLGRVKTGKWPERVQAGPDGNVYVTNRLGRSVSVVDPKALAEVARIQVGVEPTGLAFSADGKELFVANQMSSTVSVVDVARRQTVREIATAADPAGVAVVGDGKLYVTHLRTGQVSVLDVAAGKVSKMMSLALPPEKTQGETRLPNQPIDPVAADDGRVYVPHVQSKEDPVPTSVPVDAYAGTPGSVPVVANALATIDASQDKVLDAPGIQPNMGGCFDCGAPAPTTGGGGTGVPAALTASSGPLSGPAAAAVDASGEWLYVVNQHSNNVQIVSTHGAGSFGEPVKVGAGPSGLALARSGDRAYVYNAFDHSISVLQANGHGQIEAVREVKVGDSPLTPEQQLGRKLFFSAADARMTNSVAGGIACASCHPNGREDGRTWKFSEGPRNTPTLAGRNLKASAPYHWDGVLTQMHDFRMVVEQRMGGGKAGDSLTDSDFNAMLAFLDVQPAPDNPFRSPDQAPSQAAVRGKAIFEGKAACSACHTGPDLTDNGFHDVGTTTQNELFPKGGVNTPPLHNLFASAPYLHDGSIASLRERVTTNPGDKHGVTSGLSGQEVDDLVEYLKTL